MAFSINLAVITGNVTRDPELKFTPSGMAVCTFGVATNRSIKRGENWEDVPCFHNIVVWGKQAEYIANTVKKGVRVSIQGRIDNRQYEAKDGTKRYVSEIVADTVIPFTNRPSSYENQEESPTATETTPIKDKIQTEDVVEDIVIPEDLPF
jgi:single-strand DNA-binding protein